MSETEKISGTSQQKQVKDRRAGVVKSLILEFEALDAIFKSDLLRMGAEQSSSTKPQNTSRSSAISSKSLSKSLVKQRVDQFDYKLDSENQSDKRRRHKSVVDNNKINPAKDFQRSKSVDLVRRDKDRYLRSRQVSPKVNGDAFKYENSHGKNSSGSDSNNNSLPGRCYKKQISQEATTPAIDNKKEKLASIKTCYKLSGRFSIFENTLDTKPEGENNTNVRDPSRRRIKSVKSMKKTFEDKEPARCPTENKIKSEKKTSNADETLLTIANNEASNKSTTNKHVEPDKAISQRVGDANELYSKIILKSTEHIENIDDNNKKINTKLTNVTKTIINDVSQEPSVQNNSDAYSINSNSDDEFNQVQNKLQEVEQTIIEMTKHHSQSELFAKHKEKLTKTSVVKNKKTLKETQIFTQDDLEEAENIILYMPNHDVPDDIEDEFGERSFRSLENTNFIEAYNRPGDELVLTTVASVEHRLIEDPKNRECLLLDDDGRHLTQITMSRTRPRQSATSDDSNDNTTSITDSAENNVEVISESEYHDDNAFDNEIYCSSEEIQLGAEAAAEYASNRSTLYSSTYTNSTDSLGTFSKTESDEGIYCDKKNSQIYQEILENNVEIRNDLIGGYNRAIKTETIYDSFQNPRIAKVSNVISEEQVSKAETPITEEARPMVIPKTPVESLKPKKDYIIEELTDTERKYIKHLEKVVWDYMPVLADDKLPPSLIGKSRYLFGNIRKIYSTTQRFYKALRVCGNDHEEIAKTFLAYRHLFELYPLYSKNKPVADHYLFGDFTDLVAAREKQLNDVLGLASYLLTPIQRLGKYILFLEQIQKELQKKGFPSENIYKAIETVRKEMSRGNDFIAIDSIKDSAISLLEQGSFLMRGKFNVIKPRKYEAMLFLFEEMLVFTTVDPRNPELFIYRDSIKLNEMGIVTFDDQPLVFHLKRFPSYKKGPKEHHEFVIEAKKNKDKRTWTKQIKDRLWEQLVKCKEEQRELHSNQGKRNSVVELPDRVRKKKAGYRSLPAEMRKNPLKSIFYHKVERDA